jgi:hypothetical protein
VRLIWTNAIIIFRKDKNIDNESRGKIMMETNSMKAIKLLFKLICGKLDGIYKNIFVLFQIIFIFETTYFIFHNIANCSFLKLAYQNIKLLLPILRENNFISSAGKLIFEHDIIIYNYIVKYGYVLFLLTILFIISFNIAIFITYPFFKDNYNYRILCLFTNESLKWLFYISLNVFIADIAKKYYFMVSLSIMIFYLVYGYIKGLIEKRGDNRCIKA